MPLDKHTLYNVVPLALQSACKELNVFGCGAFLVAMSLYVCG
jgi:hypothetical protein